MTTHDQHHVLGSVVVGIDGSPSSDLALDWGAREASLERRPLTLVHASGPVHPVWVGPPAMDYDDLRARTAAHARSLMKDAVARARTEHHVHDVHQIVTETDPRVELLGLADGAAMVVIGSRGRGSVSSLLLGSVSSAVSTHAACPVVVIRPDDPGSSRVLPLRGVLAGFQEDAVDTPTLETAFRLAAARGLHVTVLQCTRTATPGPRRGSTEVVVAMSGKYPDVPVAVRFEDGSLEHWLVELSSTMDAVVLGSRRPSLLRRAVYGALAPRVLERASGVVVVVPQAVTTE